MAQSNVENVIYTDFVAAHQRNVVRCCTSGSVGYFFGRCMSRFRGTIFHGCTDVWSSIGASLCESSSRNQGFLLTVSNLLAFISSMLSDGCDKALYTKKQCFAESASLDPRTHALIHI